MSFQFLDMAIKFPTFFFYFRQKLKIIENNWNPSIYFVQQSSRERKKIVNFWHEIAADFNFLFSFTCLELLLSSLKLLPLMCLFIAPNIITFSCAFLMDLKITFDDNLLVWVVNELRVIFHNAEWRHTCIMTCGNW